MIVEPVHIRQAAEIKRLRSENEKLRRLLAGMRKLATAFDNLERNDRVYDAGRQMLELLDEPD